MIKDKVLCLKHANDNFIILMKHVSVYYTHCIDEETYI